MEPVHSEIPRPELSAVESAHAVFVAWEKLRIPYNAILILITLGIGFSHVGDVQFWLISGTGAVIANICYCLGPCLEGYLSLLGWPRSDARLFVFLAGTFLAAFLAVMVVFGFVFPVHWS